jgi:hypothetical protein
MNNLNKFPCNGKLNTVATLPYSGVTELQSSQHCEQIFPLGTAEAVVPYSGQQDPL